MGAQALALSMRADVHRNTAIGELACFARGVLVSVVRVGGLLSAYGPRVEDMLWHVFSNLVGNAVKFTRENREGRIDIRASREDGWVTVRIRDNGLGISPEGTDEVREILARYYPLESYPASTLEVVRELLAERR